MSFKSRVAIGTLSSSVVSLVFGQTEIVREGSPVTADYDRLRLRIVVNADGWVTQPPVIG